MTASVVTHLVYLADRLCTATGYVHGARDDAVG
jgi:hypothetical protein